MIFTKHFRALASASLLALAIASAPTSFVYAADHSTKAGCEADGYFWSETFHECADKTCLAPGGVRYKHGEVLHLPETTSSPAYYFMCNGWTGEFQVLRTREPQGPRNPQAPRPTTNGR